MPTLRSAEPNHIAGHHLLALLKDVPVTVRPPAVTAGLMPATACRRTPCPVPWLSVLLPSTITVTVPLSTCRQDDFRGVTFLFHNPLYL